MWRVRHEAPSLRGGCLQAQRHNPCPAHESSGFPGGSVTESACPCRRGRFNPWVGKIPLEDKTATHSSLLAWENPHGQRSLGGYRPWDRKEWDTTERRVVQVASSWGEKKILNTEQVSDEGASLVAQLVKNPPATRETWVLIPGSGRSAGEGNGYPVQYSWACLMAQLVKNSPAMRETWVPSLGQEDALEKGTATHSSIPAWRIPWAVWPTKSRTRLGNSHSSRSDEEGVGLVFIHADSPRGCPWKDGGGLLASAQVSQAPCSPLPTLLQHIPGSSPVTSVSTHRLPPSLGGAHIFKDPNGMNVVIVCW